MLDAAHQSRRIHSNLSSAIERMEEACADARRFIDGDRDDGNKVQRVFHGLAWGFANASSSIESAMLALEDKHGVELFNAQNKVNP